VWVKIKKYAIYSILQVAIKEQHGRSILMRTPVLCMRLSTKS